MLKIFIVDDHPVVRQGLKQIIEAHPDFTVIGEANNGRDALKLLPELNVDLVILDISMPLVNGFEFIEEIKQLKTNARILVLTIHHERQFVFRMLKAGASGYLTKDEAPNELIKAIYAVSRGETYTSYSLAKEVVSFFGVNDKPLPHEKLTKREFQIMRMLASGYTPKEIAQNLFLSPKTINTHRSSILLKMKMKKNIELLYYMMENNLMD